MKSKWVDNVKSNKAIESQNLHLKSLVLKPIAMIKCNVEPVWVGLSGASGYREFFE
jgi:hypothetical protein